MRQRSVQFIGFAVALAALGVRHEAFAAAGGIACQYDVLEIVPTPIVCGPHHGPVTPAAYPFGLSEGGKVCGGESYCVAGNDRPFTWSQEEGYVTLPVPPGTIGPGAWATDICDLGIVAVTASTINGYRAFIWDGAQYHMVLPGGTNTHSEALAVSEAGVVTGFLELMPGLKVGFFWEGGPDHPRGAPAAGAARHRADVPD
jgi:hypothetical protein